MNSGARVIRRASTTMSRVRVLMWWPSKLTTVKVSSLSRTESLRREHWGYLAGAVGEERLLGPVCGVPDVVPPPSVAHAIHPGEVLSLRATVSGITLLTAKAHAGSAGLTITVCSQRGRDQGLQLFVGYRRCILAWSPVFTGC